MRSITSNLTAAAVICLLSNGCDNSSSASDSGTDTADKPSPSRTSPFAIPAPDSVPNGDPATDGVTASEQIASKLADTTHHPDSRARPTNDPHQKQLPARKGPPEATQQALADLPDWVKEDLGAPPLENARQMRFETKFIEITRPANSPDIPEKQYQKFLRPEERDAYIRKISQTKGADLMSAPSLVAAAERSGNIQIGRQFRYQSDPQDDSKFEEVLLGLNTYLQATPLDEGGATKLDFFTEINEMDGFHQLKNGLERPNISTRRLDTTTILNDGDTLILGGLTLDNEITTEDRTPFLSDIPLIGGAFTSTYTEEFTIELIVVVTPTLLPKSE